jgi:acyl-CoA hydrolase
MMKKNRPGWYTDADACAEAILSRVGKNIVLGLPLGLGKANSIVNALYDRAVADPAIQLRIFTALTLGRPAASSALERRFLDPLFERLAGNYPELAYNVAARQGRLPANIAVHEFYFPAGRQLDVPVAQQNYTSTNYTHAARDMLDHGINVIAQLVAQRRGGDGEQLSLSCNPDVTLDLLPELRRRREAGQAIAIAAQVNEQLPFMLGPAVLDAADFDMVLHGTDCQFDLFSIPKQSVAITEYAAALHVATLIEDGGTLQIGIGGFADAVTQTLKLRHLQNDAFRQLVSRLGDPIASAPARNLDPFEKGLYGNSEMLVEGLLELKRVGVLRRRVGLSQAHHDNADGPMIHAAFFLGCRELYRQLREMPEDELADIAMTSVSFVNQLYGDEDLKRGQRQKARFINRALMATALGAVVSDGLEDGRVISGVGGQYNFVAQAHELCGARSIISLDATRIDRGRARSNIVWNYGHTTIPRHLRDIVVTEYGVADLRGKSDRDVVAAMLSITDSRFQNDLLATAKRVGKIERHYDIPTACRNNYPERIKHALTGGQADGFLPHYPLGTEMTPTETSLFDALQTLKSIAHSKPRILGAAAAAAIGPPPSAVEQGCMERLDLGQARTLDQWLMRWSVLWALRAAGSPARGS